MQATAAAFGHDMQSQRNVTQVWLPHLWNVEHAVATRMRKPEDMHWRTMPIPPQAIVCSMQHQDKHVSIPLCGIAVTARAGVQ